MPTRPNLPSTSLAAHKAAVPEMREQHQLKIIEVLKELKSANYEMIANKCGLLPPQVGRRLIDLERLGTVYKPGLKSATSTGRLAFNYSLTNQPVMTPTETVDAIISNATKQEYKQPNLF